MTEWWTLFLLLFFLCLEKVTVTFYALCNQIEYGCLPFCPYIHILCEKDQIVYMLPTSCARPSSRTKEIRQLMVNWVKFECSLLHINCNMKSKEDDLQMPLGLSACIYFIFFHEPHCFIRCNKAWMKLIPVARSGQADPPQSTTTPWKRRGLTSLHPGLWKYSLDEGRGAL